MRSIPVLISFVALASIAGCGGPEVKVGINKSPPVVTITDPAQGTEFSQGVTIQFKALVDAEGDLSELTHDWVSGNVVMCETGVVPGDGLAGCDFSFDDVGTQIVQINVADGVNPPVSSTVEVNIIENEPPTIEIVSPEDGNCYEPTELVTLEANVDDAEDNPDELKIRINSSVQGQLALANENPSSNGVFQDATFLQNGQHLLTFFVEDTIGQTAQDSVTACVNGAPSAPTVVINPDPAVSGVSLQAVATGSVDPDGDAVTYSYAWFVDSTPFGSGSPNVPSGITVRDQFWTVEVQACDSLQSCSPITSTSITIANSAPSIDSVTISPDPASTVDDLIGIPTGWDDQDGDFESYDIVWKLNGVVDATEITDTFPSAKTTRNDTVQAEFTPKDDFDDGITVPSQTVTITNAAPTTPVVAIDPPIAGDDDDLQCQILQTSTDPDGDTVTFLYEWYRNGVLESGQTTSLVDRADTELGDVWECRVYGTDGVDTGTPGSSSVAILDTTPPDAPVIDDPAPYRNEDTVDLTGTCEANCVLAFTCTDSSGSFVEVDTCDGAGNFDTSINLVRGDATSCVVTCEDQFGQLSPDSNLITTEVCDPFDPFEVGTSGDSPLDAIGGFGLLPDDGLTTITISGNLLDFVDQDWYEVTTDDDITADVSAGIDYYRFQTEVTGGAGLYTVLVYKGGFSAGDLECPAEFDGYDQYEDYNNDDGSAPDHNAPADGRMCGAPLANDCTDYSNTYYILVKRNTALPLSCAGYELTITNGVW